MTSAVVLTWEDASWRLAVGRGAGGPLPARAPGAYKSWEAPDAHGGERPGADLEVRASEPVYDHHEPTLQGTKEVQRGHARPTERGLTQPETEPTVSVALSPQDAETLLKLRDAGLIKLQGLELPSHNPRHADWTYAQFERHMVAVQKLRAARPDGRDSTAKSRVRYVAFLEEHPVVRVQLRPPSEESWLEHVHHRVDEEGIKGTALNQYRKALKSLLAFLELPVWRSLDERFEEAPAHWHLPPDNLVPRLWLEPLHPDAYLAATYAHVFHFGVHTGVRPPSELCALDLEDVDFDARRVTVTEVKKGGKQRDLDDVEPFIITARNCKSLWNYATHVRPKADRGDCPAFFLNSEGRRFNPTKLGIELGRLGRQVWPQFVPYTMRRLFATRFLIQNGFNVYVTAQRLGDTVATVEKHYLEKARARAAMRGQFRIRRYRGRSA